MNKIDVEAMKRDGLQKFEEHYPVGISRAWTQWLQDVDKLLELPTDWEWSLDILKRGSKVQRPANEDITIPDHLQAVRDKRNSGDSTGLVVCLWQVVLSTCIMS